MHSAHQVDDLKADNRKLRESDEKKTMVIEQLHEKLDKFGEQNSVLLESLQETESSEQNLRDSLTRIQSSENVITAELSAGAAAITPDEIKQYQDKEAHYLHRLDSLEEKDKRYEMSQYKSMRSADLLSALASVYERSFTSCEWRN